MKLLITQCKDPMRWYAGMVGELVECLGYAGNGEYKSREPSGCVNFVLVGDCIVVDEVNEEELGIYDWCSTTIDHMG